MSHAIHTLSGQQSVFHQSSKRHIVCVSVNRWFFPAVFRKCWYQWVPRDFIYITPGVVLPLTAITTVRSGNFSIQSQWLLPYAAIVCHPINDKLYGWGVKHQNRPSKSRILAGYQLYLFFLRIQGEPSVTLLARNQPWSQGKNSKIWDDPHNFVKSLVVRHEMAPILNPKFATVYPILRIRCWIPTHRPASMVNIVLSTP